LFSLFATGCTFSVANKDFHTYLVITDQNSATIESTIISAHQHLLRISTLTA